MRIHFLRNATLIIHMGAHRILVDPMLGRTEYLPAFAFLRHRPRRNPLVPLPENAEPALESVTAALITHCRFGHFDHLDQSGTRLLAHRDIQTYCSRLDQSYLRRKGITTVPLRVGQRSDFLGGSITPFPAQHGYAPIGWLMGPGVGYLIEFPGEPTLYISGDTVLTPAVREVLSDARPDISVLAAGSASMDIGRPILMDMDEILEFVRLAPGEVIATHMEALNHCPTTRTELRAAVVDAGFGDKVQIPEDGELIDL